METTSRPFSSEADLLRMRDLIVAAVAAGSYDWHVGDLWWAMYQNTVFDPYPNIRLWEDSAGTLLAFAWFDPPHLLTSQVHPSIRDDATIEEQMLDWGEARRQELLAADDQERTLLVRAFEDDVRRSALFARRGYHRDEFSMLHMRRDLAEPIPSSPPDDNIIVRHVGGEEEWQERVDTHREVWHPSRVTLDAYRRLRAASGFTPELDLVAVTPEGTFASYCICWLDSVNKIGEFEPVGTRPAFRGRGIGKAVILEGLRRLKGRGVQTAIVPTTYNNEAARRLYESVGFQVARIDHFWSKEF